MILNAGSGGGSSGGLKVIACGSFMGGHRQPIHPAGSGSVCAGRRIYAGFNGRAVLRECSYPRSRDDYARLKSGSDLRDRRSDAYHGEHDEQYSNSQLYCVRLTLAQEGQEGGAA